MDIISQYTKNVGDNVEYRLKWAQLIVGIFRHKTAYDNLKFPPYFLNVTRTKNEKI